MVSYPYPAQTNIPQGSSRLEQVRNTISTSFVQVFLWYLPLTGSLGVWKWQHRAQCVQELCQPLGRRTPSPQSQGAESKAEPPQQPPGPHLCSTI